MYTEIITVFDSLLKTNIQLGLYKQTWTIFFLILHNYEMQKRVPIFSQSSWENIKRLLCVYDMSEKNFSTWNNQILGKDFAWDLNNTYTWQLLRIDKSCTNGNSHYRIAEIHSGKITKISNFSCKKGMTCLSPSAWYSKENY